MTLLRRALFVFLAVTPVFAYAQAADQEVVSVVDAPDPVTPGATLTYTITLRNNGPDPATNGGFNTNLPGEVTYQNTVAPAGFTCSTFGAAVSCINPSFAVGTAVFVMSVTVAPSLVSFPDGQFSITFSPSGTTTDPNNGNNNKSATTNYDTPQINMAVAASDSPDPVTPNQNVTYTVDVTNNGPDTATNANFNMVHNGGSFTFQSMIVPAGWSCPSPPSVGSIANFTCTKATMLSGATDTFTIVVKAEQATIGINDTTINQLFSTNATGNETNNANNSDTESTLYDAPSADLTIGVSDSPDPVTPDGDITYTVTVMNNGPQTATGVNMNVFNNNSLRYRSIIIPAGWSCPSLPAVDGAPAFTCSISSFANGDSAVFTVVLRAYDEVLGINDTTVQTNFNIGSANASDPVNGNNSETEDTLYSTLDANLSVAVTDSPDPVFPDGDITYTVTLNNAGPDAAANTNFSIFNNNSLRYQSIIIPAGWSCPSLPAVDGTPGFTCTNASFASGATSVFTVVLRAYDEVLGINDTTLQTGFTISSGNVADPNGTNNTEVEDTAYVTPDANVSITASDNPDPLTNGQNVTFMVNINNAGPDPGTNAQVTLAPHPSLTFQSLSAPGGWSCTTPSIDAAGVTTCTKSPMANAEGGTFTLVTKLVTSGSGGTLNSNFTIVTGVQDPVIANNSVEVFTNWIGQTSDLGINKGTLSTAAAQGSSITYTITTVNHGPDDASNVTVTDVLQPALLFQSITQPAGWSCLTPAAGANGTVSCSIPTFTNGDSAQFILTVTVDPNATGTIDNTATVGSSTASDPSSGNSSSGSGSVLIAGNSDLGVTKVTGTTSAARGETATYTITVINNGPDPAADATMTDVLSSLLLFQSINEPAGWTCMTPNVGETGTITCSTPSLAPGAPVVFTLVATIGPNATGSILNTASVAHSGPDGVPGNDSATGAATDVDPGTADVVISKSTNTTTIAPGGSFPYTITVTNNGPDAATNVVMTDNLPASLLFQSINAPAGWNCVTPAVGATGTITCTAASLAVNAPANFTLTVQVAQNATGPVSNTAGVAAAEDGTPGNNSDPAPDVIVVGGPASPEDIPTLSEWMLVALMLMIGFVAVVRMRT